MKTDSSPRPRFATVLEIAMVSLGLVIGATFFARLWSEPAPGKLQALAAPAAPAPAARS